MNNSPIGRPIAGYVPSLPALPNGVAVGPPEPEPKKPGWPKGKPRKLPPEPPPARVAVEGACNGCGKAVAPLDLPMIAELARIARDRMSEAGGDGRTDLLYLAARVDGYCSLGCWRHAGATEEQVSQLFPRRE